MGKIVYSLAESQHNLQYRHGFRYANWSKDGPTVERSKSIACSEFRKTLALCRSPLDCTL